MTADPMAEVARVEAFGYRQELRRSLSLSDLLVYGLLLIVPTAPLASFGFVYNQSQGMVPLVYIVGLVAMLFTAHRVRKTGSGCGVWGRGGMPSGIRPLIFQRQKRNPA